MILMVCSSVFQLYVAVVLKNTLLKEKETELVLTDSPPLLRAMAENEKIKQCFDTVRFVPISENIKKLNRLEKSRFGHVFFEMFPRLYAKKVWEIDVEKYEESFFSSYTLQNVMLQYAMKNGRKDVKIHCFEDGISTYLLKNLISLKTPSFLARIFQVKPIEELVDDVYVFEKELVCVDGYKDVVSIPKPKKIEGLSNKLNNIFDGLEEYSIQEKFVFFEESFNNDGYTTNDAELIHTLWEELGMEDFILKHHPRNRMDRFKMVLPTMPPIFWENYILNHNINDKVLVAVSSNTMFVPHLLCGCEPTLVLLYKIFGGTSPILGNENFTVYVDKYLKAYPEYANKKVYVPETIEQFKEIIQKLKKKEEV